MVELDVVTFGEAMAMFVAGQPGPLNKVEQFTRRLAGAETNVAIGLARLGLTSGWVSKVGKDAFGTYILEALKRQNVDLTRVKIDEEYPTGFQLKSKVFKGDPEVQYFRKGSAASRMGIEDFDADYFKSAKHLHMTGIPLALSGKTRDFANNALLTMKRAGRTVSFDPNLRPSLWRSEDEMIRVINETAAKADWVLPGIAEGEVLTGFSKPEDIAAFYLEKGVGLVVVKLGAKGAFYQTSTDRGLIEGFHVEHIVDTVGAGDGFAVGVISALLEGLPIKEAVIRGNAIGALAVQSSGDSDGLPSREELERFLNLYNEVRKHG